MVWVVEEVCVRQYQHICEIECCGGVRASDGGREEMDPSTRTVT